ncbi:MAG: DEAD/DEAH box helicase, partial [Chloroflexi bacterium]|nr:DEAD/DEAH box helicase [Chloroflexota bacterium]
DARTPLWQLRQKAADLMAVASRYGSFPILLETYRECLQDVFDLPALQDILRGIQQRHIRITSVETASASPFARSLLFDYIAEFMYEGDAPLAERRAQALALDRERLRELLGQEELRELLDPAALEELELELQWLRDRRARNPDQLHDLLRRLGDLSAAEVNARSSADGSSWLSSLEAERRAVRVRIASEERWLAVEDVARYRDAIGIQPPRGVPDAYLETTTDALEGLLLRYARTHAAFTARDPATRWGLPGALVHDTLRRLEERGAILRGEFRPGGTEREWCDPDVLRSLRRRSLARLRREVEPVPATALARFLPAWHGVATESGSLDRLLEVVGQLEGVFLPWSIYERDVLPARVHGYQPRLLDELCAAGELVWLGRGSLGGEDGRVSLLRRERLDLLVPGTPEDPPAEPIHASIREHLEKRGASFFREIVSAVPGATDAMVLDALWDLVWSGEVTNDTLAPLRLHLLRKSRTRRPLHLSRTGPPEATGRWSLVRPTTATSTERAHALALTLLERHGVLTRESVLGEGIPGGFAAVYPVLRAMEEAGKIRRGYFVEGLGAAQFALPGAVDRLRAERQAPETHVIQVLAAGDPANPYGATLPWPKQKVPKLQRAAGAYVVTVDGEPTLYVERSHKGLVTLPAFDTHAEAAVAALQRLAENSSRRELVLERIDGEAILTSPQRGLFEQAGFAREYLSLTLRLPALQHPRARTA